MILTSDEILELGIVGNHDPVEKRATTYDARVGEIFSNGEEVKHDSFILPHRGVVWVVSREDFKLPNYVTGLATLRTKWTHSGLLALNVGIVDPNYNGPLATAVVNFSDKPFIIFKGDLFLRILFHRHGEMHTPVNMEERSKYIKNIAQYSINSTDSFLRTSSIADDVLRHIFDSPWWANRLAAFIVIFTVVLIFVTILAVFIPASYGVTSEYLSRGTELKEMQREIDEIRTSQNAINKNAITPTPLHERR